MHRRPFRSKCNFARCGILALAAGLLFGTTLVRAQAPQPGSAPRQPARVIDAQADAALRRMSDTLAAAAVFSFEAEDSIDVVADDGQKIQTSKVLHVLAQRPNKVRATAKGDREDLLYVYDGKTMTIVNRRDNVHAQAEVPDTIDGMFDFLAERYGIVAPLSDLLFANPYDALIGQVRSGRYLGLHEVGGVKCHHLAFRQNAVDWQIWIEDGERALPRKIVITYKDLPSYPQFVAVLSNWNLSAKPEADAFKASIPANSRRVDLVPARQEAAPADAARDGGGRK